MSSTSYQWCFDSHTVQIPRKVDRGGEKKNGLEKREIEAEKQTFCMSEREIGKKEERKIKGSYSVFMLFGPALRFINSSAHRLALHLTVLYQRLPAHLQVQHE